MGMGDIMEIPFEQGDNNMPASHRRANDEEVATHVHERKEPQGLPAVQGVMQGMMGLQGLWALVGNSTAMCIVAVVLFISIFQLQKMHSEGMGVLKELHNQERDHNKEERINNRLAGEAMARIIDRNTLAIESLTTEIRKNRSGKE